MKTYVKVALFFVTFIAVAAILAALYYYNLKSHGYVESQTGFYYHGFCASEGI